MKTIGVFALQGDYEPPAKALTRAGAQPVFVRKATDLEGLDGLIIPGGESIGVPVPIPFGPWVGEWQQIIIFILTLKTFFLFLPLEVDVRLLCHSDLGLGS
jgi:hypothetical protein